MLLCAVPRHFIVMYGVPARLVVSTRRVLTAAPLVNSRSLLRTEVDVPSSFTWSTLLAFKVIWFEVFTEILLKVLLLVLKVRLLATPKLPSVRSPSAVRALVSTFPEKLPRTAFRFPDALTLVVDS